MFSLSIRVHVSLCRLLDIVKLCRILICVITIRLGCWDSELRRGGPGYRGSIVARVSWGGFNWNISDKCQNGSGMIKLPPLFQDLIERLLQVSVKEREETDMELECLISSPGKFPYSWEARNTSCCVHARALSIFKLNDFKKRFDCF